LRKILKQADRSGSRVLDKEAIRCSIEYFEHQFYFLSGKIHFFTCYWFIPLVQCSINYSSVIISIDHFP